MDTFWIEFIAASLRIATPLFIAALGGILSERAGTFAVSLEGQMLFGAFCGVAVAHTTGSLAFGVIAAAAGGALFGSLVAIATARFHAEHMVTGLAANILALGLTSFLLRALLGKGQAPVIRVQTLEHALTYTAAVAAVAVWVFLWRTRPGLTLRAVGENPQAAFASGADPTRYRMLAVVAGAALAGLAGAALSLQQVGTFTDGMTAGRGYLALAAIIVGRWSPGGALAGALLFGAAEALALRAQTLSLPVSSYVIQMTPYVLALAVLATLGRTARLPAALGQPFRH
jgi:simple sugar transport system permease protein